MEFIEKGWEVKGLVVPYDLPSENVNFLVPSEDEEEESKKRKNSMRDYIRAKRIQATEYLHSLGVVATNSVVLVPLSKLDKVDMVIGMVLDIYKEVNNKLAEGGFPTVKNPVIKKIPMVQTQIVEFRELAERQLRTKLDRKIDDLAELIENIQQTIEAGKGKRLQYELNRTRKELHNLQEIAEELGINANDQFELLGEMIDQAIDILTQQ